MFKRLDAAALPEDILSNTQTLSTMAHTAGSALWVGADTNSGVELTGGHFVFDYLFSYAST